MYGIQLNVTGALLIIRSHSSRVLVTLKPRIAVLYIQHLFNWTEEILFTLLRSYDLGLSLSHIAMR